MIKILISKKEQKRVEKLIEHKAKKMNESNMY